MPQETTTLIVGASIAGLATAACLQKNNIDYLIIEKEKQVAFPWRHHYERLHLHTSKRYSNLPYKNFAKEIPRYPSRQQVIDYIDDYKTSFNIQPLFGTTALSIHNENGYWITKTNNGVFQSKYVVMATGSYGKPKPINIPGIETFKGPVLHSFDYKTGKDFTGKKVLVIGFGNSACEIAIDLYEQGASPTLSVRSPVNVVPRDVLGIPVLELSIFLNRLSPKTADIISAPLVNLLVGNITSLGLRRKPYGPLEQIQREGNAPVLDIGTIAHIRKGHIKVQDGINTIAGNSVTFNNGVQESFDAIVAAIGYYRDYAEIVAVDKSRFEDLTNPVGKQQFFGKDGLYFCGYWISPTGQIREIKKDALKIAASIGAKEKAIAAI
ncbi:MAG: NAD(P)-binding domain-containing protein [Chitinophagaceae bacterium]